MIRTVMLCALLTPVIAGSAYACTCITPTIEEAFDRADVVFMGDVTLIEFDGFKRIAHLDVAETWKGSLDPSVVVITEFDSAACGVEFLPGESWLLFATESVSTEGAYYTHICTWNRLEEYAAAVIASIQALPATSLPWGILKVTFR